MTAGKPATPALPPYVAPSNGYSYLRVTLTAELPKVSDYGSTVRFLGEHDGETVVVEVYQMVEIVALRRALAEHGAARFDSLAYRVDLATEKQIAAARTSEPAAEAPIPLNEEERVQRAQLDILTRSGFFE